MATVEFLYDYGSPYSYLANTQVPALAERTGAPVVVTLGGVGAPTVSLELLPSRDEPAETLRAFEKHVGRKADAVISFEIGGQL